MMDLHPNTLCKGRSRGFQGTQAVLDCHPKAVVAMAEVVMDSTVLLEADLVDLDLPCC